MRRSFRYLLLAVTLLSCFGNSGSKPMCHYTLKDLWQRYDSAKFEIKHFKDVTEVFDKPHYGERGVYKFDKRGNLMFYGYLLGDSNNYYFGTNYDSTGTEQEIPKNHVVRWFLSRMGADSLRVSFLLFDIGRSYGDLRLSGSNISVPSRLFDSKHFSNLIGNDITIAIPGKKTIYLDGKVLYKCQNILTTFRDSVVIPGDLLIRDK